MPVRDLLSAASGTGGATDPYFYDVSLLLNGDGTNGSQNNTFLDSSTNNFTITRNGNTTQGSFSPYGSLWSNYLNGSSTINAPSGLQTAFAGWGGRTRSYECWVYRIGNGLDMSLQNAYAGVATNGRWNLGINSSNKLYLGWTLSTSSQTLVQTTATVPVGWSHVCVCVDSTSSSNTTIYLGINGVVQTFTGNDFSTQTTSYTWQALFDTAQYSSPIFTGYFSNLRWSNNIRYSSNYTVPTSPLGNDANTLLLTGQSNRFIDNSSNAYALTVNGTPSVQRFSPFNPTAPYSTSVIGGSGYFDGSGDSLNAPNNSAFNLGTSDFTFEFWMYTGNVSTRQDILDRRATQTITGWMLSMSIVTAARLTFYASGPGWPLMTSNTNIAANTWNHIAIVRSGSSFKMYQNGVEVASATSSTSMSDNSYVVQIGNSIDNIYYSGYISNFLIVVGTAVYTANFTPPTAPVTAITNTQLLTNFTNAGIPDLAMQNNLETVGDAQVSTSVKKYGTGSLSFNGTTDYLTSNPATPDLYAFGSGDFTVEFWLYLNATQNNIIYDSRPSGGTGATPTIYLATNQISYFTNNGNRITGATLSNSTWYHIALCRSGTSTKLFVNGTQSGSTYTDSTVYTNPASRPIIGADGSTLGSSPFNGYIDDLRVTKGYARYTSNFTPPTSALPTF